VILLAASSSSSASLFDQPGTLAFLVVFGMGVILYFLLRSMARHLRKVNEAAMAEAAAQEKADAARNGYQAPAPFSAGNGSTPAP
jgi:hypothetical protein